MSLDEKTDNILKEDNPVGDAVKSLLTVEKKTQDGDTDIELKTQLSSDMVIIHSVAGIIDRCLTMKKGEFSKVSILGELINKKERKALSTDRRSRGEIVEIARPSDTFNQMGQTQQDGAIKRFFTPRGKRER